MLPFFALCNNMIITCDRLLNRSAFYLLFFYLFKCLVSMQFTGLWTANWLKALYICTALSPASLAFFSCFIVVALRSMNFYTNFYSVSCSFNSLFSIVYLIFLCCSSLAECSFYVDWMCAIEFVVICCVFNISLNEVNYMENDPEHVSVFVCLYETQWATTTTI